MGFAATQQNSIPRSHFSTYRRVVPVQEGPQKSGAYFPIQILLSHFGAKDVIKDELPSSNFDSSTTPYNENRLAHFSVHFSIRQGPYPYPHPDLVLDGSGGRRLHSGEAPTGICDRFCSSASRC
jgi:hypothetical protein